MANYRTRRFIPVALVIIIVILSIVGLVYAARLIFFPGGNAPIQTGSSSENSLIDTSSDRAVRLQVRGSIVADEKFRSYQIQISPSQRKLTLYKGYEMNSFDSTVLYNNTPAYEQLVYALDRARMMNGNEYTGEANNTTGICATGLLYQFQILQDNKVQKSLWATSCGKQGSLRANTSYLVGMFIRQIPDAQSKINSLW